MATTPAGNGYKCHYTYCILEAFIYIYNAIRVLSFKGLFFVVRKAKITSRVYIFMVHTVNYLNAMYKNLVFSRIRRLMKSMKI